MATINKINVGGTIYEIGGSGGITYEEIVKGYNVNGSVHLTHDEQVAFYSLDNGLTWHNFYGITLPLEKVSQIKFKRTRRNDYYGNIRVPSLKLDLRGWTSGEQVSENYKLTKDITDLSVDQSGE